LQGAAKIFYKNTNYLMNEIKRFKSPEMMINLENNHAVKKLDNFVKNPLWKIVIITAS
jgi:hypothetical protein